MDMEIYGIINTVITLILGGGWFIDRRALKRKANGEAKQAEAQANKEAQEYYNTTLADVNRTLNEVRAERDQYKSERDDERRENEEMRKKYIELDNRMNQMDINYRRDMAKLGRKIGVLSPFLCGVAGCIHRKKVNMIEDLGDEEIIENDNEK